MTLSSSASTSRRETRFLFFEFQRPALVGRDDVGAFAAWLAFSGHGETLH